jgi:DNA-binding MarR family transcriptional regulator
MNRGTEIVLALAKLQGAREVLELITAEGGDQAAGTKAHLLAFILGCSPCATQKDLAAKLGLTPGRVCQMLRVLKRSYHVPG